MAVTGGRGTGGAGPGRYLLYLSSTLRWPALLPGMHFFPASALVFLSVFLLACFLGPGSRVLFSISCWVL